PGVRSKRGPVQLGGWARKTSFSAGENFWEANKLQVIKLRHGSPRRLSILDLCLSPAAAVRLAQSVAEVGFAHLLAAFENRNLQRLNA
ncbi:hypothetical protein, partial [Paracoccus luteus]|uniref:hypothetical protein n=1 Tax=Paracoccus luteus TaxID=2508543 RepID=UPI001C705858